MRFPVIAALVRISARSTCRLFAVFILVCVLPYNSVAQEQGDAPEQQLPEIAPQEIEIRGELQLSFPSLKRQPLRGFASPPTIPSVPDGRMPYVEPYKQALEDLPESLPAPDAASQTVSTPADPQEGFVEMGGGRYLSRFARGRLSFPFTAQQTLSVRADYSGLDGFSPFPGSDVSTPSDVFDGALLFESRHDALAVTADVHAQAQRYTLYGLPPVGQDTAAIAPDRSGYTTGSALRLRTFGSITSSVEVSFDRTQYTSQLAPRPDAPSDAYHEHRLAFDGSLTVPIGRMATTLDALAHRASYGGDVPNHTGYRVGSGLSLQLADSDALSATLGGRFLGFEAPATPRQRTDNTASAAFIAPAGRVELSLAPGVTLFAENAPSVTSDGLADLYRRNPYAEHAPSVRPTLYTTKAESGVLLSLGPLRIQPTAGYRYAPSYQYTQNPSSFVPNVPLLVQHASARIIHGGGQIALQGLTGVEASVDVSVRDGELVGDNAPIPYFSPLVTDAMLSVSFADQRGLLQTTGTIESPRPTTPSGDTEVGTYIHFDLEGSYAVSSLLDIVVRAKNLGPEAPKKWARYARPPAMIMGGVRIHW
ncbi:hypothetical protein BSZ35_01935 [Salinibacter sp. 10B]|nr:hypothetical protein BSZ35_01935 [Salinibacter sp. 10B]